MKGEHIIEINGWWLWRTRTQRDEMCISFS